MSTQTREIKNPNDIIDSRDIIDRFEEVEENYVDCLADDDNPWEDEFKTLTAFMSFADEVSEWEDGATLIHTDYFTTYMKEFLSDIGDINVDSLPDFIVNHIDWEGIADDLKVDYSEIEVNGQTYYVRA